MLFIAIMTYISYRGIVLSERIQNILLVDRVRRARDLRRVRALQVVRRGCARPSTPSLSWLWPSGLSLSAIVERDPDRHVHLLGLGQRGRRHRGDRRPETDTGPGRILSTLILLVTYVIVSIATVAFAGVGTGARTGERGQRRRRASRCSARLSWAAVGSGKLMQVLLVITISISASRLDPDDDPADRAGTLAMAASTARCRSRSRECTRSTTRRRFARSGWASSRSSSTSVLSLVEPEHPARLDRVLGLAGRVLLRR